jgi:hypothetical protein
LSHRLILLTTPHAIFCHVCCPSGHQMTGSGAPAGSIT